MGGQGEKEHQLQSIFTTEATEGHGGKSKKLKTLERDKIKINYLEFVTVFIIKGKIINTFVIV
jgi:hypothetical protein